MWAIALKEFRQLKRDRRTVAMLFLLPFLFLIVFGYAASFDIKQVPTIVVGPGAGLVAPLLPEQLDVQRTEPVGDAATAQDALRRGEAVVAIIMPSAAGAPTRVLIDGTELFAAQAALRSLAEARVGGVQKPPEPEAETPATTAGSGGAAALAATQVDILFNPDLRTAVIMIPGLCGIILVFVGTVATVLGVVRERQAGTLE